MAAPPRRWQRPPASVVSRNRNISTTKNTATGTAGTILRRTRTKETSPLFFMTVILLVSSLSAMTAEAFLCPATLPARRISTSPCTGTFLDKTRQPAPWTRSGSGFTAPVARSSNNNNEKRLTTMSAAFPTAFIRPEVISASTRAVAELLSCCVIGVVAAKQGVLSPANIGALSKIVYGIFLPSLLMVNVAKTCVSQPVSSLLPIPVFAAIQIGAGLLVSRAAMELLRVDPHTEAGRKTRVCGTFQNSGILPLIFLNAMFRGNPEMLTRGVAYVSFYLMGWSPAFWTIGNNILTGHLDEDDKVEAKGATVVEDKPSLALGQRVRELPCTIKSVARSSTAKTILSPPIIGCMTGLTIGLSPALRWLLIGPTAPLAPVWAGFSNLTAAYTPSGVLVLAGSLANCPPGKWLSKDARKAIATVGIARWLLLPALTSALLFGGVRHGLVPQDPMLLFVLLMESVMPSAQNSVIMLQVAGLQDAAGRCARTLCTIYLVSIVPVSILLTMFLSALKLV